MTKTLILLLAFVFLGSTSQLAKASLDLPEEELARESVLPVFDRLDNVLNKAVPTDGRMEVALLGGWNFTEAIYNQSKLSLLLGYHSSEDSAWTLLFSKWGAGLNNQYVPGIEEKSSAVEANRFDFNRIPKLEYSLWGHYELKSYYGKISLTKSGVMNLHLYPLLGVGLTKYEHKTYPGISVGLGQKFYFGKHFGLRFDFKVQFAQGPNPFLKDKLRKNTAAPQGSDFQDKWKIDNIFDVGVTFLF